jgi:hypothetical protein
VVKDPQLAVPNQAFGSFARPRVDESIPFATVASDSFRAGKSLRSRPSITVAREEPSLVPICASRNRSAAVIYLTERKYLIQLLVLQLISNSCMMIRRSGNARIP